MLSSASQMLERYLTSSSSVLYPKSDSLPLLLSSSSWPFDFLCSKWHRESLSHSGSVLLVSDLCFLSPLTSVSSSRPIDSAGIFLLLSPSFPFSFLPVASTLGQASISICQAGFLQILLPVASLLRFPSSLLCWPCLLYHMRPVC